MPAALLAEQLAAWLERADFVVMRKPPQVPHGIGQSAATFTQDDAPSPILPEDTQRRCEMPDHVFSSP